MQSWSAFVIGSFITLAAEAQVPDADLIDVTGQTGTGYAASSQTQPERGTTLFAGPVRQCRVSFRNTSVSVVAELDPGYSGELISIDLADAQKDVSAREGDARVINFRREMTAAQIQNECKRVFSVSGASGNQTLTLRWDGSNKPSYEYSTNIVCSNDGNAQYTRIYKATCDFTFHLTRVRN